MRETFRYGIHERRSEIFRESEVEGEEVRERVRKEWKKEVVSGDRGEFAVESKR